MAFELEYDFLNTTLEARSTRRADRTTGQARHARPQESHARSAPVTLGPKITEPTTTVAGTCKCGRIAEEVTAPETTRHECFCSSRAPRFAGSSARGRDHRHASSAIGRTSSLVLITLPESVRPVRTTLNPEGPSPSRSTVRPPPGGC